MGARWDLSGVTPVNASGTPYALGKLYFYVTGTTTPTNCYSDAGLTSALTNPYTLGSDGKFPDIFPTQVRTKIVFKGADGNTITTWDPIDKSLEEIVSTGGAPSPAYPGLRYIDGQSPAHRWKRNSTNDGWIDEGPVDSLGNAATVTQQLAGTATDAFSTPDSIASLWEIGSDISAGSTLSLPSTGGGVFNVTGSSTTIGAISAAASGRIVRLILANAHTITHGSGINVPGSLTTKLPAGCEITVRRGASDWTIIDWTTGPVLAPARATNVVVTKTGGSAIAITADAAFCQSTVGQCYRHGSVSVAINLATTGANALDTGSQTTDWYALWLISDGTTVAGLASASFTAPTMPTGYTYKVRVGAMHSTSTTLDGAKGYGNRYYYTGGAQAVTSTNSQSNASTSLSTLVPDTAIAGIFNATTASNANSGVGVSPNNSYGTTFGSATAANTPFASCTSIASTENGNFTAEVPIETTQTVYVTTGTGGTNRLNIIGWVDNAPVN